jgi:hypothetical protein
MIYELIAGRLPYPQQTMNELYVALQRDEPMPIQTFVPTASPALVGFFARALAKDPARRFQTATELAAAFAALPSGEPARISGTIPVGPTLGSGPVAATQYTAPPGQIAGPAGTLQSVAVQRGSEPAIAPPIVQPAPVVQAMPQPQASPSPAQQAATAPRSRHTLAIGLGVLALGLIGTAIGIAVRGHHTPSQPPPDKPSPKHDDTTHKTIFDDGKDVPVPEEHGLTHDKFCAEVCDVAERCNFAPADCMSWCVFNDRSVGCMALVGKTAAGECNDLASCVFSVACSAPPTGTGSCRQAMGCQSRCNNDGNCACQCAHDMALSHAQLLLQLDNCALYTCKGDSACFVRNCAGLGNMCAAQ